MNRTVSGIIVLTLTICLNSQLIAAVKVVECKDEQGNLSFHQACPPGYSMVGEKRIATGVGESEKVDPKDINATLYLISECAACDEAKEFLEVLGVTLNVINVTDDIKYQNIVKELAGELRVPVTVIGDEVIQGYNREKFENAMKNVGLQQEETDAPEGKTQEESDY